MEAKEAKAISEKAKAARLVAPYIDRIRDAAKNGSYSAHLGKLGNAEHQAFVSLGYFVKTTTGGIEVSWAD